MKPIYFVLIFFIVSLSVAINHYNTLELNSYPDGYQIVNNKKVSEYLSDYEELVIKITNLNLKSHGYIQLISVLKRIDSYDDFNVILAYDISSLYDKLLLRQRIQVYIYKGEHSLALIQIVVTNDSTSYSLERALMVWD